jgi:hypothetical protein
MSSWDNTKVKEPGQGGDWENPPEGNHPARVSALIAVGSHDANANDGSVYQRKIAIIAFELACTKKDGSRFTVAKDFTLTLALNGNLYALVKTLAGAKAIGEGFDPSWIVNRPCMVQITHSTGKKPDSVYANIQAVTALPSGLKHPAGQCDVWDIDDFATAPLPDLSRIPRVYHHGLSRMLSTREWIEQSHEMEGKRLPARANGDPVPKTGQPLLDKPPAKGIGPGSPLPPGTSYEEVPF